MLEVAVVRVMMTIKIMQLIATVVVILVVIVVAIVVLVIQKDLSRGNKEIRKLRIKIKKQIRSIKDINN